jgi:hypothetical protein
MASTPCLETIRDAWEHLRPLIHHQVNQPSHVVAKALVEEVIKFDTILRGDLQNVVALFRETVHEEAKAHDRTKGELDHLRKEHERMHKELKRLTLPKSPQQRSMNARMPSPIEPEDDSS